MKVDGYEVNEKLYYTKEHSWIKIEGEKCRIGVTDYFQKMLRGWAFRKPTDLVFVGLPALGSRAIKSEPIAPIESAKAVADLYAPITGEISEVNEGLLDNPPLISESPYEDGWIVVVKPYDLENEIKSFMKAGDYCEHLKELIGKREQEYEKTMKEVGL